MFVFSSQTNSGSSFRLKQLGLLASHLRPLVGRAEAALAGAAVRIAVRWQRDESSKLEAQSSTISASSSSFSLLPILLFDPLRYPHGRLVLHVRGEGPGGEPAVLVVFVAREQLELRSYGFDEAVVKAVRDACTQYLSWAGLRTYLLQSVVFAKMGLPFHRELNPKSRVRLSEGLLEAAVLGPNPPASASLSSSSLLSSQSSLSSDERAGIVLVAKAGSSTSASAHLSGKASGRISAGPGDAVSRHVAHWLGEAARAEQRASERARHAEMRLLAVSSGELFGAEAPVVVASASSQSASLSSPPSSPSAPSSPSVAPTVVAVALSPAGKEQSEPFYSYPRSTPLRLESHATWLRRLAMKELRHSLLALGFQVRCLFFVFARKVFKRTRAQMSPNDAGPEQIAAKLEVPGRGRIEVFAGFRNRLTAFGWIRYLLFLFFFFFFFFF
jgi:hypothetical protein